MRTTLTLDDDVAAKLKAEVRRSGRSFRDTVNDVLRRGLATRRESTPREPFRVEARDLGALQPGLSLDSIADLIERAEGPHHR
jgi:plasmid stability protein